jgi:hypothetical protein
MQDDRRSEISRSADQLLIDTCSCTASWPLETRYRLRVQMRAAATDTETTSPTLLPAARRSATGQPGEMASKVNVSGPQLVARGPSLVARALLTS